MEYEIVEIGTDPLGQYIRVWGGARDKRGHREGIMTFYGIRDSEEFLVGRKIVLSIKLVPEEKK